MINNPSSIMQSVILLTKYLYHIFMVIQRIYIAVPNRLKNINLNQIRNNMLIRLLISKENKIAVAKKRAQFLNKIFTSCYNNYKDYYFIGCLKQVI